MAKTTWSRLELGFVNRNNDLMASTLPEQTILLRISRSIKNHSTTAHTNLHLSISKAKTQCASPSLPTAIGACSIPSHTGVPSRRWLEQIIITPSRVTPLPPNPRRRLKPQPQQHQRRYLNVVSSNFSSRLPRLAAKLKSAGTGWK